MNFIKKPNLPENSVKYALCSELIGEEGIGALNSLGVNVIKVPSNKRINTPVASHPDINCLHYGGNVFLTIDGFNKILSNSIENIIDCEKINNRVVPEAIGGVYPSDVLLNAVVIGDKVICNPKTISAELKRMISSDGKLVVAVNQGYTKCSVAVLNENAIITDDVSIYNSCHNLMDVLLIKYDNIILKGYGYGFIGGASGKIAQDKLAFFGDVSTHANGNEIKSFCKKHGVECISLFEGNLRDYGGIIPILE